MDPRRAALGVLVLAALVACERTALTKAPVETAREDRDRAEEATAGAQPRERVFYPRGACSTGWIQVQRYRQRRGWIAHPEHPRVRADTIQMEEASGLLDLRVRCFDPADRLRPSKWLRGVSLQGAEAPRPGAP